jgi:hypothetical protein
MRAAIAALTLTLLAAPAAAETISPGPEGVAVTIYRLRGPDSEQSEPREGEITDGLAMIVETRTIDVPAGPARISFRGVAEGIVPQSAAVEGLPVGALERNFDFSLLTPGSLLEHSVGRTVRLIRTDRATGRVSEQRARVVSAPYGVVLEPEGGGAEALRCSGLAERLVFDEVPASLADRPTLSLVTNAPAAGRHKVKLSYLTTGLDWQAGYVARIRPDGKRLDLTGWITLANHSGTSFVDAPTQVVAGTLEHDEAETRPVEAEITPLRLECWPTGRGGIGVAQAMPPPPPAPMMAFRGGEADVAVEEVIVTSSRIAEQSDLGDYKLYTLPEPTTVAARQSKQVLFLDQKAVPFERYYAFDTSEDEIDEDEEDDQRRARLMLRLKNREADGLGKPLPGGVYAVMEPGAGGRLILAGEAVKAQDTPIGLPVELELGQAMDLVVETREVASVDTEDGERIDVEVEVRSAKPVAVKLEYRHRIDEDHEDFKIVRASQRAGRKGSDPLWVLDVPAEGSTVLTYTFERAD